MTRTILKTKKTTVNVESAHITNGVRAHGCDCPVGLALKELINPNWNICVETDYISLTLKGTISTMHTIGLPPYVQEFIGKFDNEQPVNPFSFDVYFPEEVLCPPK